MWFKLLLLPIRKYSLIAPNNCKSYTKLCCIIAVTIFNILRQINTTGICHSDERLVTACLRSLRICFMSNQVPSDLIYEDIKIVSKLVHLLSTSSQAAEYAANILERSCNVCCFVFALFLLLFHDNTSSSKTCLFLSLPLSINCVVKNNLVVKNVKNTLEASCILNFKKQINKSNLPPIVL